MQESKGKRGKGGNENRAFMCESDGEARPKDGVEKTGSQIAAEHEIHAKNDKNPNFHIPGDFFSNL